MNFIRKIIEKKIDIWVKKQFTRYGKGTYENKAVVQITKGKSSTKIQTSFEFAGELAYALAESIDGKTRVTGGIITTQDVRKETSVPIADIKQFAGVKTFLIDTDLTKVQVQDLFDTFPHTLIFLSFKTDKGELKTKVKNPKSSKPGTKENDEEPKADFCTFRTSDEKLVKDFAFDVEGDFKEAFFKHTFVITDLAVPKEYEKDFAQARFHAVRKGKLIRERTVDGTKTVKEYSLEV